MKYVLQFMMVLLFLNNGYALDLPKSCNLVGITSDNLTLKGQKERLVFIHNISETDLYLSHISNDDPGAQAGWTSRINKNKWSVLKLDKTELSFQCVEYRPGHEQQTSCQNKLSVCQIIPAEKPTNDSGNYWVAENLTLSKLLQAVSSRGFQLNSNNDDVG